jgi:hypothetical protein
LVHPQLPRKTWYSRFKKYKQNQNFGDARFQQVKIKEGHLTAEEELRLDNALVQLADKGFTIDRNVVTQQAKRLFPAKSTRFNPSWSSKFMWRFKWVRRMKGPAAEKEWKLSDWNAAIAAHLAEMTKYRTQFNLNEPSQWCNLDESPLCKGISNKFTSRKQGTNGVQTKESKNGKERCTVVLAARANGTKLPLAFVFKGGKTGPRNLEVPPPHRKFITVKGSINDDTWNKYLDHVYLPNTDNTKPRALVFDNYICHSNALALESLQRRAVYALPLHANMTSVLQPLDVGINMPWKRKVKQLKQAYLDSSDAALDKIPWSMFVKWSIEAWDSIDSETIIKAFSRTGVWPIEKYPPQFALPKHIIPEDGSTTNHDDPRTFGHSRMVSVLI